ncbi:MAG: biotin/lipoate A/B protein ligase family protein [Nitrospiraceae bacterium]|nr:biotin/lipoate A/B protein ligase family protein [Nitrospiraceae bacterium]MDA8432375.1 biotin/lipoate A/B protein ligase family protein [Nitrospiraceae bacterium]
MGEAWRLIDSGRCGAAFNMALDEAIATRVRRDGLSPVLRLYGWDRPSLSLGCFQKASEVDAGYCRSRGIPIVRRPTGGRAILHDEELTYSFAATTGSGLFSHGLLDSYRKVAAAFHLAFQKLGVRAEAKERREKGRVLAGSPLCFQSSSYGEILVEDKKVVGSAQKRWEDGMLQQGSFPYVFREDEIRRIFGDGQYTALKECTIGLREVLPGIVEERFREAIISSFGEVFGISFLQDRPSPEELSLARGLEEEKYLQDHWNFRR